jgi:VIT1/CCC1 family predicted Fe2+/Mn2+ transporter
MGEFDYLPEDQWYPEDVYPGERPPVGRHRDTGQPAYAPAPVNGSRSRLVSDGQRAQGYPPPDGRTRAYPLPNGRQASGYARPDSGPMPAYQPPGGGPTPGYRPSGPMPAYRQPDGRTQGYPRPDSGAFPAYILPNGGGVAQGYPLLDDRPAPAYPPPDGRRGYPPADSGPMPAYRQPRGRPAQGYPPADDRAAYDYPRADDRADFDYSRADDRAAYDYPRADGRPAQGYPPADDRAAYDYPPADDRVASNYPRAAVGYPPAGGKSIMGWLPFGNRLVLLPRGTQFDGGQELREHRDISGGWLRPAVFGAMDGLVTNSSLIAGVGGGGSGHGMIVLTGIAGLIAGAFSMATGEYISVTSQNDLTKAEVELERLQHERDPQAKLSRLTEIYTEKGVSPNLAEAVVRQISADQDRAVNTHVREELGIDPDDLPSPRTAATASFAAFTVGALLPLSPFLLGFPVLSVALAVSAAAALVGGAALAKLTGKSMLLGGLRQFTAAFLATGMAFGIGHLISGHVM